MSSLSIRLDPVDTPNFFELTFYVKNRKQEDVIVNLQERELDVTIKLDDGKEYQYTACPLYGPVAVDSLTVNIRPMKVEIKVIKQIALNWPSIEAKGSPQEITANVQQSLTTSPSLSSGTPAIVPSSTSSSRTSALRYPNSKGKDWSNMEKELLSEVNDLPEEGDPTNNFFKKIFSNGTSEQQRAMMKSFQESNGTVLSTNWEDVGGRFVKGEPPKGMEAKQWGE